MKQNFSISFSARLFRSVQLCALLGILLSFSSNAWAYGETTSYVKKVDGEVFSLQGNATSEKELKSYDLTAPCSQITFYAKTSSTVSTEAKRIYLYEYDSNGTQLNKTTVAVDKTSTLKTYDLNINTRKIKFTAQSSYTKTVTDLKVTRATTLALSSGSANSLDFGTVQTHSSQSQTITVDYNNTTYNQPITSSCSNNGPFSITTTDAGESGTNYQITVNLSTAASGEFEETLTVSMKGKSIQVPVKATIVGNTALEWNQYFTDLITNNPDIPLTARVINPANGGEISTSVTFSVPNGQNVVTITNDGKLHLTGNTGNTTITAEYAGVADTYDACRETREIVVSSYAMPVWQNDWTTAPDANAEFYLYNTTNGKFVKEGLGENKSEAFVDAADATLWKYTNDKKIVSINNSNNYISNKTGSAQTDGKGNASECNINFQNGYSQLQTVYKIAITYHYIIFNDNGKFSAEGNSERHYEWYLVSADQMTYHAAAVEAINDYLLSDTYAIITGGVRDNLETAVHATSNWTTASTNLTNAISAFMDEYDAIDQLSLTKCDGYQMLYTGENKVKILDQTAVAYTASWNENSLTLTPVDGKVIPAHTSVLIYDNTDKECVYTITQDAAASISQNAFEYHNSQNMGEHTDYVLSKKDDIVAFRKYTGDETVADNHNVLVWRPAQDNPAQAPAVINIETEEMAPTALVPVYADEEQARPTDNRIFNIMGLEVSDMSHPGIYIQNGKKYIIR